MSVATRGTSARFLPSVGTLVLASVLAAATIAAWVATTRDARAMAMPSSRLSLATALLFVAQWGTMMTAMMLPSAAPMVLLYRTVRDRLVRRGERAIPASAFAAIYLVAWMACGIPVYLAWVGVGAATERWRALDAALPWAVAAVVAAAGAWQLTSAKRACLRRCESPLGFLMSRWRSGYVATARLALAHAGWCIGCCWGLMAILVVAGAMSLPWVVAITVAVAAEKLAPPRWRVSRAIGTLLLLLALAIALRPSLALTLRGAAHDGMHHDGMDMS